MSPDLGQVFSFDAFHHDRCNKGIDATKVQNLKAIAYAGLKSQEHGRNHLLQLPQLDFLDAVGWPLGQHAARAGILGKVVFARIARIDSCPDTARGIRLSAAKAGVV